MQVGDLTTLANVKAWLNANGSATFPAGDDALLGRLVTAASKYIIAYLSRSLLPKQRTYTTNGWGTQQLYLPEFPLLSVQSLVVDGVAIAQSASPPLGSGFLVGTSDGCIYLNGACFTRGFQNVTAVYTAGFQTVDAETIPSATGNLLPVSTLSHPWACDVGVSYANGTALVLATSAPAAGQYQITTDNGVFNYKFNVADASAAILVTYGYTPEDIEQACIELLTERYKTRNRIGQVSVHIGTETVSFSQKDMNDNVKTILNQYRNVVPA